MQFCEWNDVSEQLLRNLDYMKSPYTIKFCNYFFNRNIMYKELCSCSQISDGS